MTFIPSISSCSPQKTVIYAAYSGIHHLRLKSFQRLEYTRERLSPRNRIVPRLCFLQSPAHATLFTVSEMTKRQSFQSKSRQLEGLAKNNYLIFACIRKGSRPFPSLTIEDNRLGTSAGSVQRPNLTHRHSLP